MSPLCAAVAAALLAVASASASEAPDALIAARTEIKLAFITGSEGPDPAAFQASKDPRAEEVRILASGLRDLRAGSTLDRVAAFSYALDPVAPPTLTPEVLSRYLRAEAVAAAQGATYGPERAKRFQERLKAQIANLSTGIYDIPEGASGTPGDAAPYRAVPAGTTGNRHGPYRTLQAAPPFVSPDRGASIPFIISFRPSSIAFGRRSSGRLCIFAITRVAGLDDRLEDLSARRDAAWRSGRPLDAASLVMASIGGHIVKGSWSLVAGATGKDSAKNIAKTVLYQPAALLDYRERQAAVARPGENLAGYLYGTAINLAVLTVEVIPGGRAAGAATRTAYGGLVREAKVAFHDLEQAETGLASAQRRLETATAGSAEHAALEKEAGAARANFEIKRAELDAARKAMVEHRMAQALDHDFHGSVDSRLLEGKEAAALNARFVKESGSAPFHEGVPLYQVTTTKAISLCRTHHAADLAKLRAVRGANGDWFIPCETYHHFDQKHLRDLLALPDSNAVDFVARYEVPAGTKFYVGAAGPIRGETAGRVETMYTDLEGRAVGGGGNGGKVQFFLDPHINSSEAVASDAASVSAMWARQAELRKKIVYQRSSPVPREHDLLHPMEAFRTAAEARDTRGAKKAFAEFMQSRREQSDRIRSDGLLRLDYERVEADMRETYPAAF